MGEKYQKLILPLVILLALILRVISLNQSLWLDEAINVLATQKYSFLGMITEYAKGDFHPPGYFIILWVWTHLFGINEIVVRIPSVIFALLTVYIIFLIGRKLYSKNLGYLSALLLAINPLHIFYSQEARMYSFATLAVLINMLLITKLFNKEKLNIIFLILSDVLILSSDYVAYLIFPAQLIFLIITKRRDILKSWFIALFCSFLLGIWWLPIFLSQLNIGAVTSERLPTWKFVVGSFDIKSMPLTFVKFIIGRISLDNKLLYGALLLPICLLFSIILVKGIKFATGFKRALLSIWFIIPIVLASLISLIIPIYNYFRLMFTLPAFILLIGLSLLSIKSKTRYILILAVILIHLFSAGVYLFDPSYQREDWRGLVNFLKLQNNTLTLFESSGTLAPFDYYAKNTVNAKGALKDFPSKDENDVLSILNDQPDIYLVDYLVDISDPKRLVSRKLINLGYELVGTNDFHGVGFIYHYQKIL